ncbi:MAG: NADH:ubiquinone reductase (Na(+)-transporting) subunit D [Chromatiales bacterium]|jgi:Na+-transporting NADH:ubiquinone oxidoreductase subunit D|nr:MAG: NADH:ubiquinone reductase (Na(+)-transporting) subunit D [Chromatiales bacterium]
MKARDVLLNPIIGDNPITRQVLGICSALAITNSLRNALVMSLALTAVLVTSNVAISLLRRHLVASVRLLVQMTIIASAVIVADEFLRAYAPDISRTLSVFVGLIVTNCIVLGRTESFALRYHPGLSALDGLGNGLGYGLVLVVVAAIRELFGTGALLDIPLLPLAAYGGWFRPNALLLLPPSAFFIIAGLIWLIRSRRPEQVEKPDVQEVMLTRMERR